VHPRELKKKYIYIYIQVTEEWPKKKVHRQVGLQEYNLIREFPLLGLLEKCA
jgi:hypothetical protein